MIQLAKGLWCEMAVLEIETETSDPKMPTQTAHEHIDDRRCCISASVYLDRLANSTSVCMVRIGLLTSILSLLIAESVQAVH